MTGHIPLIVELHAEDAAILWLQRDRAVDAPHFNRMLLWRLDERLEANLDGLRVAGRAGWDIARAAFDAVPEPGETFVLAALAFGAGSARGIGEVLEIVAADTEGTLTRAAVSALGWLAPAQLNGLVQPLLDDRRAAVRGLGLGACLVHRVDPGDQLARFLDDQPPLQARAMQLAGALGRRDLLPRIAAAQADAEGRFRQAWASVLLGGRGAALDTLGTLAARPAPQQRAALDLLALALTPAALRDWIATVGAGADMLAVRASGPMGLPDLVPWLIGRMADPAKARAAGESFAQITGADLAFLDLDTAPAADEGPNDTSSDPDVALDSDLDLPVPDPAAVADWWARVQSRFRTGQRHLLGEPASEPALQAAFDRGYQRQRRLAALALVLAEPGRVLPNWCARERQRVAWKARAKP